MAILTIKTGGRGRPIKLDTQALYESFERNIHRAAARLAQFRKNTKGYRGEELLGTYSSLPDFALEALETIDIIEGGGDISPQAARKLKADIRTIERLASKQERVYSGALADKLEQQFYKALDQQLDRANKSISKKILKALRRRHQGYSKAEIQSYYFSKEYQDPRRVERYKRVKEWAEREYEKVFGKHRTLSYEESWSILLAEKSGVDWWSEI